jgi:hypothetical protein
MLDRLPPELHVVLARYLDPPSLVHLGATSKAWRDRTDDPLLWQTLCKHAGYTARQSAGDDGLLCFEADELASDANALNLALRCRRSALHPAEQIGSWKQLGMSEESAHDLD